MKVLYIGVYRDGTGWGQAAIDYILALDAAGIEVVPRPLKLSNSHHTPPERIRELEKRSSAGCDVVIQHILPHQMEFDGRFSKNIALFASETDSFRWSHWPERLNLMDEVWCINRQQKAATYGSGVKRPVRVVPHATDITRFQKQHKPLERLRRELDGGFTFYTIGELVRRKNLPALIKAFHLEFSPSEPVNLVIKATKPGFSADETAKHIGAMCDEIKSGLKLYRRLETYHREIIITERFSDEDLLRLHASCDCFVCPSFGEAWCIPAFDAMAMGKTPIVTNCGGFSDYLTLDCGWLVNCRPEPVFGEKDTFQDLFVGHEQWSLVNINHLRACMRTTYENEKLRKYMAEAGIDRAYDYTYERIGSVMKGLLEE